ncbi:VOC family protein [Bacillus swezeyi]|uniref:PhnB-like domain-containing protein n=1 Tax=Bacillus swezeyi TaxID=1925020 RepID=A0A1R1QDP6_9BACI|nr:VOC family protein [Bacillus swezeyi]MEC1261565.1 VOC family protein [Bacillus swezeyi]MED2926572.1 VOC family protein [Bacillus swezeyi]MED2944043.1 VOC family protein [Bacillus swezeyi]MED2965866.1 VOC family protein [Bacillus swezeyi]MED2978486.1 VOC family protein [Bacillus swezeyi]
MTKVTPFLMFQGHAEKAMNTYISLIEDSEMKSLVRYGADEQGKKGSVKHGVFSLKGQEFMCIDSPVEHDFTFTPSFSMFLTCDTEAEIDRFYQELARGGEVLMPLGDYGFSQKFGWIVDQFGISWQIDLSSSGSKKNA